MYDRDVATPRLLASVPGAWIIEREGTLARSAAEGQRGLIEREGTLARSAAEGQRGLIEREARASR